jgi:putative MATE family efflux protein
MRQRLKEVTLLAAPIVAGNLAHNLVSLVDTWMVGRLPGGAALDSVAALGAASSVFLVVFLVFSAITTGVQVLVARRMGEGHPEAAGAVLTNALVLGLAVSIPATVVAFLIPSLAIPYFVDDATTQSLAIGFLDGRLGLGLAPLLLLFVIKGFLWGTKHVRLDLMTGLVLNGLNLLLNWMLIFGKLGAPALGVRGAGLASALAAWLTLVWLLALLIRGRWKSTYGLFRAKDLARSLMARVAALSWPRALQGLAFSHTMVFFALIGAHTGKVGLAASNVVWRLAGLTVVINMSIGAAAATLVGQALGRGQAEDAKKSAHAAGLLGAGITLACALPAWVASDATTAFILDDATAAALAGPCLALTMAFQIPDALGIVYSRALTGAGDVRYVALMEIVCAWMLCLPATWYGVRTFAPDHALLGAWGGWAVYCTAWMWAMLWRWRQGRWRSIRV